jgi:hypothetical protein
MDLMDYGLNFQFDTDPERGAFFPVSNEFYALGGWTETSLTKVRYLDDGGFMVFGRTQDPWQDSLLTSLPNGPPEQIDLDFGTHGLFARSNSSALSRQYRSVGHLLADPTVHVINSQFEDGWQTTDGGFVAAGIACPGPAHPCREIPYIVKTAADLSSAGLTCSCTNGYADCDESGRGFKTASSIRPGDCGGSCGPCAIDCTDGVQDGDEEGPDCGGSCTNPKFSPDPHECACHGINCNDGKECTTDTCNASSGACENPPAPNGTPCSTGKCDGNGQCKSQCSPPACDDRVCNTGTCDPKTGCHYAPVTDGTSCAGGVCQSGACVNPCATQNCDDGDPCTVDSCDPTTGACSSITAAPDGTTCTTGVCLGGSCSVPNYVDNVQPILQNFCGGCHGGTIGHCSGNVCLAQCYAEATKTLTCSSDPTQKKANGCMASYVESGFMPFGSGCSPTNRGPGCPTELDINVIKAWSDGGAKATGDGSRPPACH